jgi:hypothetical protein
VRRAAGEIDADYDVLCCATGTGTTVVAVPG